MGSDKLNPLGHREMTWRMANQYAVPGTGKSVRGYCKWLRQPHHIGFERAMLGIVGSLRGVAVPPNSWDDEKRSSIRDRSWKRYRRTQYHPMWRN